MSTSGFDRFRPGTYVAASVLYMFFAMMLLGRIILKTVSLSSLGVFAYFIALIPVCIIAARLRVTVVPALALYLTLAFVGVWGGRIGMNQPLSFSPAPTHVTIADEIENSLVLAILVAVLNFVPALLTWLAAKAVLEAHPKTR